MILARKRFMLKSELAWAIGVHPATLKRMIDTHSEQILLLNPQYTKKSQLLSPKVISYLLEITGFTWEEILQNDSK